MERIGGSPLRTYVSGETLVAISLRFGRLPSHVIAALARLGPSMTSFTSVTPNQLIAAATVGTGIARTLPIQPALSGIIALVSARCPPADSPIVTIRLTSMV